MNKYNGFLGLFFLFALYNENAMAYLPGWCTTNVGMYVTVSPSTVYESSTDSVGTALQQIPMTTTGGNYMDGCTQGAAGITLQWQMWYSTTLSAIGQHVYQTSLPGIGVRAWNYQIGGDNATFDSPANDWAFGMADGAMNWNSGWLEIIKTGPVTPGELPAGKLGTLNVPIGAPGSFQQSIIISMNAFKVVANSCSIMTPTVNVPLGEYRTSDFASVGSTTASQPVNIVLDCNSGIKVNAVISSTAEASQAGTIALTQSADTATGIGVQLLDANNNPLAIGTSLVAGTTTGKGNYNINWQARYIRTATAMTAGAANATATVTISYE